METCLILSARKYDFQGKDGKRYEGVTLTYLTDEVQNSGETLGSPPLTISGPLDVWTDLRALPGFYELELRQRPGKGGRVSVQLAGVRYVEASELFPADRPIKAA